VEKYFAEKVENMTTRGFEITSEKNLLYKERFPGLVLEFTKDKSSLNQRSQLLRIGNFYIHQSVFGTKEYLHSTTTENFFMGVEVLDLDLIIDEYDQVKADSILQYFASGETDKIKYAQEAIEPQWAFDSSHLPTLRKLLLAKWPEGEEIASAKDKLIRAMSHIDEESSIPAMRDLYKNLHGKQSLQESILFQLAALGTAESMNAFFDLYNQSVNIQQTGNTTLFAPFEHDVDLFISHLSQFVKLIEEKKDHIYFWRLAELAIREKPQAISPYFSHLVERAQERLLSENKGSEYMFSFFKSANIESTAIVNLAEEFFEKNAMNKASLWAADFLLAKNKKLDRKILRTLLDQKETYYEIIKLINANKAFYQIRNQDYQQAAIADGMIKEYLDVKEKGYQNLSFIEILDIDIDGNTKKVYVYTFSTAGQDNFVGIAGFFSSDDKEKEFTPVTKVSTNPVSPLRRQIAAKSLCNE